jgi:hypothetical protein
MQYSSKDVGFVMIDGYDILGTLTNIQSSVEAILQSTLVLGSEWETFASVDVKRGALSQSGFYDDAAGSVNEALTGMPGASRVFVYCLESNTIGNQFIGYGGVIQGKYERVAALEKLHVANALYSPSGPIEQGQILHARTEETAAGNTHGTSVDNASDVHGTVYAITSNSIANPTIVTCPNPHGLVNGDVIEISGVTGSTPTINGERTVTRIDDLTFSVPVNVTVAGTGGTFKKAKTTNGGAGFISCSALALGGYTDLSVKIQHSVDNAVWVDLVTFTPITAIRGAERVAVAPGTTVNRYLSAIWAFTGAGAGPSAKFMVGFTRA